jgi:hypothetical protein
VNASPPYGPGRRWPGWIATFLWYAVRTAVTLIRIGWWVFLAAFLLTAAIGLAILVFHDGWWWLGLIVAAVGYATLVLLRNRRRRRRARLGT